MKAYGRKDWGDARTSPSVMDQSDTIFEILSCSFAKDWIICETMLEDEFLHDDFLDAWKMLGCWDDFLINTTENQDENNACIYDLDTRETGNITPDTGMEEREHVSTRQKIDDDEAPPRFVMLCNKDRREDSRDIDSWKKNCKGQFPIPNEKYGQRYRCEEKVALIEKSHDNKRLIENRHKRSNDIEVNPGPTTGNLKELENFLRWEDSQQAQFQNQIHKVIRNLFEDATNRKIPEKAYTEVNLNTIQDMFFLTVKKNYETDIVEKMEYLLTHFYDIVREEENKQGTLKRRVEESGVEIVTFHGELKRDIGTQFPEKLATTTEEESEDNSTKENAVPIIVTRKTNCTKRKRKDTSAKRTTRVSRSAHVRIQIHGGH